MQQHMVPPNEEFEPTDECEQVLEVFKDGRDDGEPWGRANPRYIIDETDLEKPNVEYHLRRLTDAGWIRKVARGQYEFVGDPREQDDQLRGDGAGAIASTRTVGRPTDQDDVDALLEGLEDDDPYAEVNQTAIELVRQADDRLKANQIQAAVADELEITPESWWERHGSEALKDAGADHRRGAGWRLDS